MNLMCENGYFKEHFDWTALISVHAQNSSRTKRLKQVFLEMKQIFLEMDSKSLNSKILKVEYHNT